MARHTETRRLPYSPQQLFELVADVEQYAAFIPLWREARISQQMQTPEGFEQYTTDQILQIGPFRKRFRTHTTLETFHKIHIASTDLLFKQFSIDWHFQAEKNEQCTIVFALNCVANSPLLRPAFDIAMMDAAQTIVTAFETRAKDKYQRSRA